ncbi:hypothetical protein FB566_2999 [Stackebrandtia endophytica]|uniref:Pit accessory protein n=1 Tax=Stackebrandtia endophytica TaxID=1496996 RepID=A0A543AY40_9ACTN|nr:DUF47 family protein [Stackebrandtia endophytica]TQL77440.1 hypothetical protein FB566_2999 [Stackebrandtia endophytica]
MRFSLRPQDDAFYKFFTDAANNIVKGTAILAELAEPEADAQSVSERLVEVEHANDDITHELYNKINSTFVTPLDREDLYALGSQLDDVMDHIEAAGNLVYLYGLSELPAPPREMIELFNVLTEQARITADAMPKLKGMDASLRDYWIECNRLENDGDRAYRMLLVRLFSGEYEALTVLKLKEVADELEKACDAFEHVSNTVETISVKES